MIIYYSPASGRQIKRHIKYKIKENAGNLTNKKYTSLITVQQVTTTCNQV